MSTHIFPPSHFETAERLDVEGFNDPNSEIIAELALTLPVLKRENGVLGFSRYELASYHMLHYGAGRAAVKTAVETVTGHGINGTWLLNYSGIAAQRIKRFEEVLNHALEVGNMGGGSLALGRIAVHDGMEIPDRLEELTEAVDIPHTNSPAMRPERFLYPNPGVAMSYTGAVQNIGSIEYLKETHQPIQDYVEEIYPRGVYFDTILARKGEDRSQFVAVSSLSEVGRIVFFEPSTAG